MPIDPRIPLGIQVPPPGPSPMEMVQSIAQIQAVREQTEARRLAAEKARQQAADEAAVRQVLTETGGDIEKALPRLRQIAPKAALEFQTELGKQRTESFNALTKQVELRGKTLDLGLKVAQGMTDETSYQAGRPMLLGLSPDLAKFLPETYDPAAMERLTNMGLSAKELHDQRQESLKLFGEGKIREALATQYSLAQNPQEWQNIGDLARKLGADPAEIALFGDYSPANVARAAQLGIAPAKREELVGQSAQRTETATHNRALEATAAGQLGVSRGQLAVAQGNLAQRIKEGGAGGVKLTGVQQEEVANMLTVEQLTQEVQAIDKKEGLPGVGPVEGRFYASARGSGGPTGEKVRNLVGNIQGTIAKIRGGTAFSEQEKAMLDSYTPTITDTDATIRTKLATLTDFIQKKRQNTLRVAAGQYTLPTVGPAGTATTTAPATGKNPFRK